MKGKKWLISLLAAIAAAGVYLVYVFFDHRNTINSLVAFHETRGTDFTPSTYWEWVNFGILFVVFIGAFLISSFVVAAVSKQIAFNKLTDEEKQAHREEVAKARTERAAAQQQLAAVRQSQVTADPTPKCPRCGCTTISADKKGFGVGKAVVGAAVAGPLGLVAGNIGAKKVRVTCLNCGHHWTRG